VDKKAGLKSVLYKSLYNNSSRIRDCLLSITNMSQECSITNFCETQEDFSMILKNWSSGALELIQDSFLSTHFTKKIVNTKWSNK